MSNTYDLDAFLPEILGQGATIRLYGTDWKLKPEIPTLLMLRLRQDLGDPDAETSAEQEIELLRSLLDPPEQVDALLAAGLGRTAHLLLIRVALAAYTGRDPEELLAEIRAEAAGESPGEAEGGQKPPTSSPSTGRGSKRTSKPSTA